jgi:ureidoacrylate peracid hydrolase
MLKIVPKETGVLVIDMQNDFVDQKGKFGVYGFPAMAQNIVNPIKKLLIIARETKIPIIYTQHVHRPDYLDAGPRSQSKKLGALIRGSWGAQIVKEIEPTPDDFIIEKHRYSAFYNTDLEIVLRGLHINTLIVTGVATNVCVESTVRDACIRDFNVVILSDCTATNNQEVHEGSLKNIPYISGSVSTSEEIIKTLKYQTSGK